MKEFFRRLWRVLVPRGHSWEYRNPYARRCVRCGRCECMYQHSWGGPGWWEQVYPLPTDPSQCGDVVDKNHF